MHEESALPGAAYRRAPVSPASAGVSFVMPVLNEEEHLENAVKSVLSQRFDGPAELVLALGPSSDQTAAIAEKLAASDDRITIVENPQADIPIGLNVAIAASKYPTIVRVDAHSELAASYTARALETLMRTQAANVGGIMHAEGKGAFQQAAARAYNSKVGLGGGAYHGGEEEGAAESAYLGVMCRAVLEEVGLFDTSIRRGEDWELNLRIRQAGYQVWFDPKLSVTYWPRASWTRLARQFFSTGTWRGELVRRFGRQNSLRFFAPPVLVVSALASLVVGALQLTGALPERARLIANVVHLPIAAYAALDIANAVRPGSGSLRVRLWSLVVLPTMHLSWGAGFIRGMLHGANDTVDTSRLDGRNTPLP